MQHANRKQVGFADYILKDAIKPKIEATDKQGVIREMVQCLLDVDAIKKEEYEGIVKAVFKREELGTTGIGRGIAIPHIRYPNVDRHVGTFGISIEGIDFECLDEKKAHLFFLVLSPSDDPGGNLRAMEHLTRRLKDDAFCHSLIQAKTREEIFTLLENADDSLREKCIEGLKRRYAGQSKRYDNGTLSDEVAERLDSELSAIRKAGYGDSFMLLADIARFAKERQIALTAVGSAPGALTCYALGVTHVCPLEYDLLFERFLLDGNAGSVWIDIHAETSRRLEISEYVKEQLGDDGKAENPGIIPINILDSRDLAILASGVNIIKEMKDETTDPFKFPLDDKETFALISHGETKGISSLEGHPDDPEWVRKGFSDELQRMRPDNIRDIMAALALYRPGPLSAGMLERYINVKHGREKAEYLHPVLEEILSETYGVIVYQEQVMRILNRIGKIPFVDSYTCIKAVCKKREDVIGKYRTAFRNGARENGLSEESGEKIFDSIVDYAGDGFLKAHAATYALSTYMLAYLKTHYPAEFEIVSTSTPASPIPRNY